MSLTTPRKAGHVLGVLLGLGSIGVAFGNQHGSSGPPTAVVVFIVAAMVVVVALLVWSWAGGTALARRIAAVLLALNALSAVPGMLVPDIAGWLRLAAGVTVVVTIAVIVLLFYPDRRAARAA